MYSQKIMICIYSLVCVKKRISTTTIYHNPVLIHREIAQQVDAAAQSVAIPSLSVS
jgi:hypothetical protein